MENHGCYTASQIEDLVRKAGPLAQARALILADMSEEIQDMHMDDHRCQIALNATPKKKEALPPFPRRFVCPVQREKLPPKTQSQVDPPARQIPRRREDRAQQE
ncbi:MAG: hypothetical protein BCS36_02460 [Desulfovibrio sp. MES5]|nr:MAG: hypothetical protein BCS36_02460 [Desulfovibrio sp. MES5]